MMYVLRNDASPNCGLTKGPEENYYDSIEGQRETDKSVNEYYASYAEVGPYEEIVS